jgi:hypothetical protein
MSWAFVDMGLEPMWFIPESLHAQDLLQAVDTVLT